jgi:hypothetical protein
VPVPLRRQVPRRGRTNGAGFAALSADDPHHVPEQRHPREIRQPPGGCPRCGHAFRRKDVARASLEIPAERVCEGCQHNEKRLA